MASIYEYSDGREGRAFGPARLARSPLVRPFLSLKGLLASAVVCLTAGLAFTAAATAPGAAGEPVMAVFPPTSSAADVMVALHEAGGELLTLGRFDNAVVSLGGSDGYADRLYGAGAILVIDPAIAHQFGL